MKSGEAAIVVCIDTHREKKAGRRYGLDRRGVCSSRTNLLSNDWATQGEQFRRALLMGFDLYMNDGLGRVMDMASKPDSACG